MKWPVSPYIKIESLFIPRLGQTYLLHLAFPGAYCLLDNICTNIDDVTKNTLRLRLPDYFDRKWSMNNIENNVNICACWAGTRDAKRVMGQSKKGPNVGGGY